MKFDGVVKAIGLKQQGKDEERKYFVKGYNKNYIIGNETLITLKKLLGNDFETIFGKDDEAIFTNCYYIYLHDKMFDRIGSNEMDEDDKRVIDIRDFLKTKLSEQNSETDLRSKSLELAQYKFQRVYASLSKKAIEKILPLMKPLNEGESLSNEYTDKINELIALHEKYKNDFNQYSPEIERTTKKSKALVKDFILENRDTLLKGNWPEWAAAQLLFGRHTAAEPDKIAENYHDIQPLGKEETLRNPVVEQIVNETLQLVKSIWKQYDAKPSEIRVELARELKNNAEEREKMFKGIKEAERLNKEAAYEIMLLEYKRGDKKISPKNECIADGCNSSCRSFTRIPTPNEITKYKIWKEQGFVSPYTGNPIPLCKLFDGSEYNKEHIIPKQRFFDNSNSNLVIAEKAVNDAKDNRTAWEFIEHCKGGNAGGFQIRTLENFERYVRKQFHGRKQKNLLLKEIPEDFVERQKKDTQYIAIKVKEKLAGIVGLQNVTTTSGGITDYLREHWKLNNIFKELSIERYKKMALLTTENEKEWVDKDKHNNWILKEWSKRLDHRHHAIDALVIACTSQGQITQLNTLNQILQTNVEERKDQLKIEEGETPMDAFLKLTKEEKQKILGGFESMRMFDEPWDGFIAEARKNIESIVVSHKPKQRILIQNREDKKTGKRLDELMLKV
ncbi:MAG: hypothetical protein COX07_01855, partial [Bacteroidetes bacterium CG23_combo_of_CG06-09_8_20_14_all_32_9]